MSLDLSFRTIQYDEPMTDLQTGEETGDVITYKDYIKIDEPNKGAVYLVFKAFEFKERKLWAFSDPTNIPANRYLSVTAFMTLAGIDASKEDLQMSFTKIADLLKNGEEQKALSIAEKCNSIIQLTDPMQKYLNLATAFLLFDDENPLYYDKRMNKAKLTFLGTLSSVEKKRVCEWTREYFDRIIQNLMRSSPECFVETKDERDFFNVLEDLSQNEREMEDFLNAVAAKSQSDRDRLMMYPVKSLYADMCIYIRNSERIREHYER